MGTQGWIALAILVAAAILFLTRKLPFVVTALLIPVALLATGVVKDTSVALQGFGNHAVIAIGAIFVVGAGLEESGVAALLARGVRRLGGRSEMRLILLISASVAVLSAFMSNAATVAVLIPAVVALSRQSGVGPGRLLMPLGFSAILGGNLTLIGTAPNLLVSNYLRHETGEGFGVFDFAVVGAPIVIAGILYMMLVGRRFLPTESTDRRRAMEARLPENLARSYGLSQNLYPMRVTPQSSLCGQTLAGSGIGREYQLRLVMLMRPGNIGSRYLQPEPDLVFQAGDHLYIEGAAEQAWLLSEDADLQIGMAGQHNVERILRHGTTFAEATLAPRSSALGKTLKDLFFRGTYGLNVVTLWRRGKAVHDGMAYTPLQLGDFILVSGPPAQIQRFARDPDYVVMVDRAVVTDVSRSPLGIFFLLVAVVPPLFGWADLAVSALAAAVLMAATGTVSLDVARRSVDWTVLLLIVGTLPLGQALEEQGVAAAAADGLLASVLWMGKPAILAALFFVAALVSVTSSNAAAAVVLAPIAAQAAIAAGIPMDHALLAVAYGCSCAFLVPFAHQCNLMVMGPGGYKTRDFLVAGSGMSVVVAIVAVAGLALL